MRCGLTCLVGLHMGAWQPDEHLAYPLTCKGAIAVHAWWGATHYWLCKHRSSSSLAWYVDARAFTLPATFLWHFFDGDMFFCV